MWSHALKELSSDGQRLFLTLTLLPEPVSSDILQVAYTAQKLTRSESFLDSLRSLEDSFISIEKRYAHLRSISFRNPSLEDFAKAHLDSNSDWLDSLLSAPKYYEQIIGVFSLAMAQTALLIDPADRSQKPASPKYPGVKAWVERRAPELIDLAVELIGSDNAYIYVKSRTSRLSQLLEILAAYDRPTRSAVREKLQAKIVSAINPNGRDSANIMVELLRKPSYRNILDEVLEGDAAELMRENILDKDSWKFGILKDLDRILALEVGESWDSWGNEYVDYALQLTADLKNSDDYEDLRLAISELETISDMLGVDLYDEIAALEQRRDGLPQDEDYDDGSSQLKEPASMGDDSAQLDKIFSSLL
jgi:hypothetical protein